MDPFDKMCLRDHCSIIVENINVEDVLDCLIFDDIIDDKCEQLIMNKSTREARVRQLLAILPSRGPKAYASFCNALVKVGCHDDLLQKLDHGGYDEEVSVLSTGVSTITITPVDSSLPEMDYVDGLDDDDDAACSSIFRSSGHRYEDSKVIKVIVGDKSEIESFSDIQDTAVCPVTGNIAIGEKYRILLLNESGEFIKRFHTDVAVPTITVDGLQQVIITCPENDNVSMHRDGVRIRTFSSKGAKDGQLDVPLGVACDDKFYIYIADSKNGRVSVFTDIGSFYRHIGVGVLQTPTLLYIREKELYVADSGKRQIFVFHLSGSFKWKLKQTLGDSGALGVMAGLCVDIHGHVIVGSNLDDDWRLVVYTPAGRLHAVIYDPSHPFQCIRNVNVTNEGTLVVADQGRNELIFF